MNVLLLIPSVLKVGLQPQVAADRHPRMDYQALADALRTQPDTTADLIGYAEVAQDPHPLVRLTRRLAGADAALALLGFFRRGRYEAIFTNGENVGLPLALLLKLVRTRPGHVCIGHRLSTGKKQLFLRWLKAHRQMDTIFVYATAQYRHARERLKIPADRLALIAFHADSEFYRPMPSAEQAGTGVVERPWEVTERSGDSPPLLAGRADAMPICSAGLEWRDYPTLIEAVKEMRHLRVRLAAASPWSKHTNETQRCTLPAHVEAKRYEYGALRDLYAESAFVVVPLYETDFQAGVTTLLEAMAMGKAVIVTQTSGQTDVVSEGETGLTVKPGDVAGWQSAIGRLEADPALRERLGRNARQWIEQNATLERWVKCLTAALVASALPKKDTTVTLFCVADERQ